MRPSNRPARDFVERVAREEAVAAGVSFDAILNSMGSKAVRARRLALRRVKCETGCSTYGLAAVFGCDHGAVLDALRDEVRPAPGPYDKATIARLRWAHGDERAAKIVAGTDKWTAADLAAWNALGSRRAA